MPSPPPLLHDLSILILSVVHLVFHGRGGGGGGGGGVRRERREEEEEGEEKEEKWKP